MGYCYSSGSKVRGRWKFDKCDGRLTACCGDTDRNKECSSYCTTYKQAVDALEDWLKLHPDED